MKTIILLAAVCLSTVLTGCRTVAVVDRPAYVASGSSYYGRPYYSSSYYRSYPRSRYYSRSAYPSRTYRNYDRSYSYGNRYYGRRGVYSDRTYYRTPRTGATVVFR
jgi:hypothetical protein